MRGCFVTGTGTGVGKTVVAAAMIAALRSRQIAVRALKPIISGLDEAAPPDWPHDHELLARAAGSAPEESSVFSYGPAVSPHLAQELGGPTLDLARLRGALAQAGGGAETLIVEGVGGLLVPITANYFVRDLARDVGLPLVIAARAGLGTINHTLLTLEAARAARLAIAGVVLTPWPDTPGPIERSNRATIERLGAVSVATLPRISRPAQELLAAAGRQLPLERWVA